MLQETHDWLLEHLPPSLRAIGPQQLSWWQWLGLPVLAACAAAVAIPLSRVTRALLARLLQREREPELDRRLQRVSGPLWLGWATLIFALALRWLRLHEQASSAVHIGIRAAGLLAFYWALSRGIDVLRELLSNSQWGKAPSIRSLLPLGAKVGKVFVVVLAVMAFLAELGYAVTSLVAGLGIGGVAVALGAQKTLENLFGAFSIGADQPFLQGDAVRVGDVTGTVEVVGLRSTRIRTLERTLVTIPNGKLADQQVESFAARDRLFLNAPLRLVYGTSAAQIRTILQDVQAALREQPKLFPEGITVRFAGWSESSLNVDVSAWFTTTDWNEFLVIRQELLLRFMEIVERAGSAFAFPSRTVYLQQSAQLPQPAEARLLAPASPNSQPAGDT